MDLKPGRRRHIIRRMCDQGDELDQIVSFDREHVGRRCDVKEDPCDKPDGGRVHAAGDDLFDRVLAIGGERHQHGRGVMDLVELPQDAALVHGVVGEEERKVAAGEQAQREQSGKPEAWRDPNHCLKPTKRW